MFSAQALTFVAILIASVVVHELAHAWQARREGDDTAERLGRLTLNPLAHLDPIGSVILPFILIRYGGFIFGWAKPVPVNPANYRSYVAGDIRVSLAGIVANLGLALLATLVAGFAIQVAGTSIIGTPLYQALMFALRINLILAFFNLIPIPPLDGSHVVAHLLPPPVAVRYRQVGQYGLILLMAFAFLLPGVFDLFMLPVAYLEGFADRFIRLWI